MGGGKVAGCREYKLLLMGLTCLMILELGNCVF